jgi:hypothetical protein
VPRGFLAKPRWQRMITTVAGLHVNRYPKVFGPDGAPTVGFIEKNSPAANREMHFVFLMMVAFVL